MSAFKIILLLLIIAFSTHPLMARTSEEEMIQDAEIHFLFGYKDFIDKRYDLAADAFYKATQSEGRPELINKAQLYLALSQAKLGNKAFSSSNAVNVKRELLTNKEKELFKRLKYFLGIYYEQAYNTKTYLDEQKEKTFIWAMPYAGSISYSAESAKSTALFYGAFGLFTKDKWTLALGGESFHLNFKDNTSYAQTQGAFSFSQITDSGTTWSARYTQISSATTTQDGIKVFGLAANTWITNLNKITFDAFYSNHGNSALGKMDVYQTNFTLEHWLVANPEWDFWLRLGDQANKANAQDIKNGSSFIKNNIYNRIFGEVNLRSGHLILGGSYWIGSEAFGVRNDGVVIYSGTEEHLGGYSGNLAYLMTPESRLQLTFMNESINTDGIRSAMTTVYAMLAIRLN